MSAIELRVRKVNCRHCGAELEFTLPSGDTRPAHVVFADLEKQAESHQCSMFGPPPEVA